MTLKLRLEPMPVHTSPTDTALAQLAATAAYFANTTLRQQPPLQLLPAAQRDSALLWSAAVVHPLDRLETTWQGIVLDAARGVEDLEQALQIENAALSRFCFLDVQPLRLLGVEPGQDYAGEALPLMSDRLRAAKAQVKAAEAELAPPGNRSQAAVDRAGRHLEVARRVLVAAFKAYPSLGDGAPRGAVPLLQQAYAALVTANRVAVPEKPAELRKAMNALTRVLETGAAVQVFHNIGPFYLLRLLVRFRILSQNEITGSQRTECSSALTKLLTNGNPWVTEFLRLRILELDRALTALDPAGNVLFFLKGGRALAYNLGTPERGENDWDTQIVINPLLNPVDWYDMYLRVYNMVLMLLEKFKREFGVLLAQHADELRLRMEQLLVAPVTGVAQPVLVAQAEDGDADPLPAAQVDYVDDDEDDAPPTLLKRAGCKAELIDIGIPRRESIEAIEQWALLAGKVARGADNMPIPGATYYVNEYLMLVRQGVSGAARAPGKTIKRALRLYLVLDGDPQLLPAALATLLPASAAAVAAMGHSVAASAHAALLKQFADAFDLRQETGLAACFDAAYAEHCANPVAVIPDLPATLAEFQAAPGWDGAHDDMVAALAYAGYISERMQRHWRDRAVYMAGRRAAWLAFAEALTGSQVFSNGAEIRVALSGSLAAALHAGTINLAPDANLPLFDRVELSVVCRSPDLDLPTVWALLMPIVQQAQLLSGLTGVIFSDPVDGAMLAPADHASTIGEFDYVPIEGRIVLESAEVGFPSLAIVDDVALLALPDLIRQYRRWAGHTEESATVQVYRRVLSALSGLLTRFEDPEPMGFTVTHMRLGRVHHLQLSSISNANGPAADYPPAYYPDRAYRITLTNNPQAALRQLSMPPDVNLDRSIDLLVINQGHGGPGQFDTWSAQALTACVVEPLRAAGVRVRHLVLDFCVSASLIPTFTPLCTPDGCIYGSMYTITQMLLQADTWRTLLPAIRGRRSAVIGQALQARMRRISAIMTGESHLEDFRARMSEREITDWLLAHSTDRDAISVIRYLPQLKNALFETATPEQSIAELALLAANANLGDFERAILRSLGALGHFTPAGLPAARLAFAQRLLCILTASRYQIELSPDQLAGLPAWQRDDAPCLWMAVIEHRGLLLSQAPGPQRCPTTFAVYDQATGELTLDRALQLLPTLGATPLPLAEICFDAFDDVTAVLCFLNLPIQLNGQADFLQR